MGKPNKATKTKTTVSTTFRIDPSLLARADELVPALSRDDALMAFEITQAAVLRLAIARGLEALEREYAGKAEQ